MIGNVERTMSATFLTPTGSSGIVPSHAMPIEPPAIHPRVASQEGRFVIFGRVRDLLDEEIRLEPLDDRTRIEELRLKQIKMRVDDADDLMLDLAQLGVSRRTIFPDLAGLADFNGSISIRYVDTSCSPGSPSEDSSASRAHRD
jgi:hypothetical protein